MDGLTAQHFLLTTCSAPHPPPWGIKMWDNGGVKSNIGNRLAEIITLNTILCTLSFCYLPTSFLALSWCFFFLTWDRFHRIENTKRRVGTASVLEIPNNLDREHSFCWYQTTQSQRPTISCASALLQRRFILPLLSVHRCLFLPILINVNWVRSPLWITNWIRSWRVTVPATPPPSHHH